MVTSGIYSGTCTSAHTHTHTHHTHTYMHAHPYEHAHTRKWNQTKMICISFCNKEGHDWRKIWETVHRRCETLHGISAFPRTQRKPKLLVKGRDNRFGGLHWITGGFVLCWNPGLSKSVHLVTSICHRFNYRLWMKEWEPEQRNVARLSPKSHPFSSWMAWILAQRMSLKWKDITSQTRLREELMPFCVSLSSPTSLVETEQAKFQPR